jgi:hypothetical protein
MSTPLRSLAGELGALQGRDTRTFGVHTPRPLLLRGGGF